MSWRGGFATLGAYIGIGRVWRGDLCFGLGFCVWEEYSMFAARLQSLGMEKER